MSNNVNKKEGTLLSATLMTILAIVVFLIGMVLVISIFYFLFSKILGLNTSMKVEDLLKDQLLVPDHYSDLLTSHSFIIAMIAILFPVVFFLAIRDRFKGSYMNLIDFKKYKLILAGLVLLFVIGTGGIMYAVYNSHLQKEINRNSLIQEQNLDEKGYFNDGVKKMEIIPKLSLICMALSGCLSMYVALATAEATNRKNLEALMQNNPVYVRYDNVEPKNSTTNNIFK